ncbi:hypothetical protein Tco_0385462 [Tanacetum coccineum]
MGRGLGGVGRWGYVDDVARRRIGSDRMAAMEIELLCDGPLASVMRETKVNDLLCEMWVERRRVQIENPSGGIEMTLRELSLPMRGKIATCMERRVRAVLGQSSEYRGECVDADRGGSNKD